MPQVLFTLFLDINKCNTIKKIPFSKTITLQIHGRPSVHQYSTADRCEKNITDFVLCCEMRDSSHNTNPKDNKRAGGG